MLYFFSGNSEFLVSQQVKSWKEKFVSKFGDFNCLHIDDLTQSDNYGSGGYKNFLMEQLTAQSFGNAKKLVLLHLSFDKKEEEIINFLLTLFERIPEENIVVFYAYSPDKRTKGYKEIVQKCEHKEFDVNDENDIIAIINKEYPQKISPQAIVTLISYKKSHIGKIKQEIDKLLIRLPFIDKKDVSEHIIPEGEENIFDIINDILAKNPLQAIKKIQSQVDSVNIYAFYNGLLANLRTNIYIEQCKQLGKKAPDIVNALNLGKRGFLVTKNHRITFPELKKLYLSLLHLDKKMKTGSLFSSDEDVFQMEVEKAILSVCA